MRYSRFAPQSVGMCPGTLIPNPMAFEAADVERSLRASADSGFPSLSLWLTCVNVYGIDAIRALINDLGISVRVVEAAGQWIGGAEPAVDDVKAHLDAAAALGADLVAAATIEPSFEFDRALAGFALTCEHAAERDMRIAIEFIPGSAVADLETAWRLVRESGAANAGLLLDTVHWHHQPGGPNFELLRTIPGDRIFCVQLCDSPPGPTPPADQYLQFAMSGRSLPGDGVVDFDAVLNTLDAIDADPYFAIEVFSTDLLNRRP